MYKNRLLIIKSILLVGWYCYLLLFSVYFKVARVVLLISSIAATTWVLFKVRHKDKRRCKKLLYLLSNGFSNIHMYGLVILLYFILCTKVVDALFDENTAKESTQEQIIVNREVLKLEDIQLYLLLEWTNLSEIEKLDILNDIAYVEGQSLGLVRIPEIVCDELVEQELGNYRHSNFRITISKNVLKDKEPWRAIECMAHELRHCYQYNLVEAYETMDSEIAGLEYFQLIDNYADEFNNYHELTLEYDIYYELQCETDAREYSDSVLKKYISILQ